MELYNGKYCGTYEDFAGIMTAKAIQHRVQRGQIEQARRACIGTPALFVVDSFLTKERVEVYRRYPDLKAQAESKPFIDSITPDGVAAQFYADYKIDDVRGLNYDKQIEYTNNASILAAFRSVIERADSRRASVSKPRLRRTDFWRRAAQALPRIADKFPHSLPENPRRLQEKFNEFYRGGQPNYEVLVSGKFQNANASSIRTDEQRSIVIRLMSDHRNLNNEQIAMLYNIIAEKMRSIETTHGTIGFRICMPKLKPKKTFTWAAVLNLLKEFGKDYIRTVEEPARDKLLADRDTEECLQVMEKCGIDVVQDETFYVEPKKEGGLGC